MAVGGTESRRQSQQREVCGVGERGERTGAHILQVISVTLPQSLVNERADSPITYRPNCMFRASGDSMPLPPLGALPSQGLASVALWEIRACIQQCLH